VLSFQVLQIFTEGTECRVKSVDSSGRLFSVSTVHQSNATVTEGVSDDSQVGLVMKTMSSSASNVECKSTNLQSSHFFWTKYFALFYWSRSTSLSYYLFSHLLRCRPEIKAKHITSVSKAIIIECWRGRQICSQKKTLVVSMNDIVVKDNIEQIK